MRFSFLSLCALAVLGLTAAGCDVVQDGIGSGGPIASNNCAAPTNVTASSNSGGILITWTNMCSGAYSVVQRSVNGGTWTQVGTVVGINVTSHLDSSYIIDPLGAEIEYRVKHSTSELAPWGYAESVAGVSNDA